MDDYLIYAILATVIALILGLLIFFKNRKGKYQDEVPLAEEADNRNVVVQAPVPVAGGVRNRAAASRNQRARMLRTQAQRHQEQCQEQRDSASEDENSTVQDDIVLPEGKIGKKKLAKLQMKAEKRAQRERDERERKERKEREEKLEEIRKLEEKREAEEEAKRLEEERKRREEEEKREQEEYERMKLEFKIDEEGYDETTEDDARDLLKEFIQYIKKSKVVLLEDVAAVFKLKTQDVIDRINALQKEGELTGVIDDRGKFIFITEEELESVAKFIRQRGRVSLSDLAEASNSLINLNPDASKGA